MVLNWLSSGILSLPLASIVLASVLVLIAYFYLNANKNQPPGPIGLPYLGYWPFLDTKTAHLQLDALKKKYGDVFSFTSMGQLYINLGTTNAVREAHITKSDFFASRPRGYSLFTTLFGDGISFIKDEQWKTLRKFFTNVIRERGMGALKDNMSGPFYDCINTVVNDIRAVKGEEPIPIIKLLTEKCNTIMRLTLFGEIGTSEEVIKEINEHYEVLVMNMTTTNLLLIGNFSRYLIFPFQSGYFRIRKTEKLMISAIYKIIEHHKATYNGDHLRDMIDDYLHERNVRRSKGDPTAKYFTDKALMGTLAQIISDGVLSVASFISMFIKILVDHPEEQEKIYKELTEVIGPNRQPTIEDKSKLTYTNAFLQEALRVFDFFAIFPSLECTKETTLGGYKIPKGAITVMNIYSSHIDPRTYEEPQKFNPSRFITTDGKQRPDLPISFGGGKRSCIGEGFTMTQVFTFLTSLVKNFRFKLPEGTTGDLSELFYTGKLQILMTPRSQ